jgi:glycosyltransferase involved in cell wall biosynthesis
MKYSIIIPVYNRPDEVDELLQSLTAQTFKDFEVVIVEDGSDIPCQEVVEKYADRLNLKYFTKPNSGPGQTRNYGVERSQGEFVIILDSDVVLPAGYLQAIEKELKTLSPNPSPSMARGLNEVLPIEGELEGVSSYNISPPLGLIVRPPCRSIVRRCLSLLNS